MLFLDGVDDIPLQLQVKLLCFLQERVIERIESRRSILVDTHRLRDTSRTWGNVRELKNRVKRAGIMADTKLVSAADLDFIEPGEGMAQALNIKTAREAICRSTLVVHCGSCSAKAFVEHGVAGVLTGITVIELAGIGPAPFAGMVLSLARPRRRFV